ncbi:hypothetical protein ACH51_01105 [Ralstonia solanacearum]|nr:hypothetical protein ACH51_01105 [Ralstonia solanacearum]
MTTVTTKYAARLPAHESGLLKTRVENSLLKQLHAAQDLPQFTDKRNRRPSSSLLVRRALAVYLATLLRMTPDQLQQENLELDRLA